MKLKFSSFLEIYERHLSTLMFLGGFVLDNILMKRVDLWWDDLILICYLLISGISIIFANIHDEGKTKNFIILRGKPWFMFAMQFVLGGLFSSFFVFYSRSGTLVSSWPFLLVLVVYMISNEFFKGHYARSSAQIAVFFTALFSFSIFFLPIVLHKIGDQIFLLSGALSLFLIIAYISALFLVAPERMRKSRGKISLSIFIIFSIINIFYFTNIIPPLPLALKEVGVYESVTKNTDGTYLKIGENRPWYGFLYSNQKIKIPANDSLYVFSSVWSPTKFSTHIIHVWQKYDEKKGSWLTAGRIVLPPIVGGQDGGYRTYSMKGNITPGLWRVDIETESGLLIGRIKFTTEI